MGLYCGWSLSRFVEFPGDIMCLFDFGERFGVVYGGFLGLC